MSAEVDHDQIAKTLIELFFREFMELFCPMEAERIDFGQVEFLKQEYFSNPLRGEKRLLDLVVKVGLKAGGNRFVLIHVEFESTRKDTDFPKRMFEYLCHLFVRHNTVVIPIAVFTDDAQWRKPVPDVFELSLGDRTYVRFNYHLVKLKHLNYRDFLDSKNPLALTLMAKMNYSRRQRVRLKAEFLRLILATKVDDARQSVLLDFVDTYMPLEPVEQQQFDEVVLEEPQNRGVQRMVASWARAAMEKGKMEGKKEGKKEGELAARQKTLSRLLERKFGSLDAAARKAIAGIESTRKLDNLLLKVLDAESLADLGIN